MSQSTHPCTVNFAYNDTRRGIKKVSLFAKCRYTRSLIIMYHSGMGLCAGHGNSVVIHELSLYPKSLLAKLTVLLSSAYKGSSINIELFSQNEMISLWGGVDQFRFGKH